MPRPNKHNNLVDDNWGATEYADEYYENEDWQESGEADAKASPKPKPVATAKPKPAEKPVPQLKVKEEAAKPKPAEKAITPSKNEETEPILETYDNWEDAMDALENHMSAQEEKKNQQKNTAGK